MRHRSRRHAGYTLMELLISMGLTSLMVGVIVATLTASMHVWRRTSAIAQGYPPAYQALNLMADDLRNAAYIIVPPSDAARHDWIISYPPLRSAAEGNMTPSGEVPVVHIPLTADLNAVKRYYLSDETGHASATGTCLWVHEFRQNSNNTVTTTRKRLVVRNCLNLAFACNPSLSDTAPTAMRIYTVNAVAVTVQGQQDRETYQSRFDTTIAFRNPLVDAVPATPTFAD